MSQTFKKKTLVIALATALVSVAVVPSVASANVFADTSVINTNSSSTFVQAKAFQLPGNVVTVTEQSTGAIAVGDVTYSLDNSARFSGATLTASASTLTGLKITPTIITFGSGTLAYPSGNALTLVASFGFKDVFFAVYLDAAKKVSVYKAATQSLLTATIADSTSLPVGVVNVVAAGGGAGTDNAAGLSAIVEVALKDNAVLGAGGAKDATGAVALSSTVDGTVASNSLTISLVSNLQLGTLSGISTTANSLATTPAGARINGAGQLVLPVAVVGASNPAAWALSNISVNAASSTTATPINLTVTGTGTGANGVNSTTRLASVSAGALISPTLGGSALTQANSAVVTLPTFTVKERFAGDAAASVVGSAPASKVLTVALSSNAKLTSATLTGTGSIGLGYSVITQADNTTATTTATTYNVLKRDGSIVPVSVPPTAGASLQAAHVAALTAVGFVENVDFTRTSSTVITFTAGRGAIASAISSGAGNSTTAGTAGYAISDSGVAYFPVVTPSTSASTLTVNGTAQLSTSDTGALTATVSTNSIASTPLTLGAITQAVAGSGTTSLSLVDAAPVGQKVYTGRAVNTVFGTNDYLSLTESVAGQIPSGSAVTATLNVGNYTTTLPLFSVVGSAPTFGVVTTSGNVASVATTGVSTAATAGDYVKISAFKVDLTSVTTAGDLTVTLGGNPSLTSKAAVKVASIVDATSYSVSGSLPSAAPSASITLPDVVITEADVAAITAGSTGYVTLAAAQGQLASFDASQATLKAYKADGTDVSASIFGAAAGSLTTGTTGTSTAFVVFAPLSASTTTTGPVTLKVSGLKAALGANAAGNLNLVIGGTSAATGIDVTSSTSITSNLGGQATKATLKVGSVISSTLPTIPAATVTGTAVSQTITAAMSPAGNDLQKPGQTFVIISWANAGLFSLGADGSWTQMKITAPASTTGFWGTGLNSSSVYSVGNLANIATLPIAANVDLTSIPGAVIYVGYGTNGLNTDMAFTNMINNGTYRVVCTVASNGLCK